MGGPGGAMTGGSDVMISPKGELGHVDGDVDCGGRQLPECGSCSCPGISCHFHSQH